MRRLALLMLVLLSLPAAASPRAGFGWPLPGTPAVDRGFAPPTTAWGAGHRGVDLRGEVGEPVLSAGPGTVVYAGLLAGRGVVTVSHAGGLRTTYEPVAATARVGEVVSRGTPLGRLGTGHASCRAGTTCLHWGLLRGDTYLDPLALLVDQPVRLLPLASAVPGQRSPVPALQPAGVPQHRSTPAAGALAAAGSLAIGLTLLATRRRPAPQPPPRPVDLMAERSRRRAA